MADRASPANARSPVIAPTTASISSGLWASTLTPAMSPNTATIPNSIQAVCFMAHLMFPLLSNPCLHDQRPGKRQPERVGSHVLPVRTAPTEIAVPIQLLGDASDSRQHDPPSW